MRDSDEQREPVPGEPNLGDVEQRLRELRDRKQVRWTMSRQTAELAIAAIAASVRDVPRRRSGSKSRRRKRTKRLL